MTDLENEIIDLYQEAQRRYHAYMSARAEESRYPTRVRDAYQAWAQAMGTLYTVANSDRIREVMVKHVAESTTPRRGKRRG